MTKESDSQGDDLRRAISRGVRWTAAQSWGTQFLQFLVFSLLARLLAPEQFGIIGIATIFVSLAEVFAGQAGLSAGLIQRPAISDEDLDTAFWISTIVMAFFAAVLAASAGLVGTVFGEPDVVPVLRVMALIPILGALGVVPSAQLSRELKFKELSIRSLTGVLAGGVVGVSMAVAGFGVWAIVGQQVATRVVGTLAVYWATSWRPHFVFSQDARRWLVPFSVKIVGRDIVAVLSRRADNFIIGLRLNTAALGYYTVGYRAFLVATEVFLRTTSRLAFPTLSRIQSEGERLRSAYYSAVRLTAFLSVPAFVGLGLLSTEIVEAFFGSQWTNSAPVLTALAISGLVQTFTFFDSGVLMAIDKPGVVVKMGLLETIANVGGFLIGVNWGIVGVAIAYSARALVMAPFWLTVTSRHAGTSPTQTLRQYAGPLISALVMAAVVLGMRGPWLAEHGPVWTLCIAVPTGTLTYVGMSLIVQRKTMRQAVQMVKAGGRSER